MEVSYDEAVNIFEGFHPVLQVPSLHPYYVNADALRDQSSKPVFFIYNEGTETYYHAFHVSPIQESGYFDIQSPYGYGGPIATIDDEKFLTRAWAEFNAWCDENKVIAQFIRFHPLLENWRFFPGEVFDDRSTVWVDLNKNDLLMSYSSRVRTAIRKAYKNDLRIAWEKDEETVQIFVKLYCEAMRGLQAEQFYFFPESYYQHISAWDHTFLGTCRYNGEIVAVAIFLVVANEMEYHLSASNHIGNQFGATNLLIHEATLLGKDLGCQFLHLGGGSDNSPQNSLLFFKSGFSGHRASFKIGKYIHLPQVYRQMREEWEKSHNQVANRVLFYRF
jgi:hypothetical protein